MQPMCHPSVPASYSDVGIAMPSTVFELAERVVVLTQRGQVAAVSRQPLHHGSDAGGEMSAEASGEDEAAFHRLFHVTAGRNWKGVLEPTGKS